MEWLLGWIAVTAIAWLWSWANWTAVAAIATIILAAGVGIGFWRAKNQLEATRRSTNAQLAVGLFRELRNNKALKILRFIYSLKPEDAKNLSGKEKRDITYVLERLGMLGALVANGIIDEKLAIEAFGGVTVLKCWYQLKGYIEEVQKRQGSQWGKYAEDFASRTLDRWKDYKDDWVLYYRNIVDEPIDLVKKLSTDEKLRPKRLSEENYLRGKGEV